MEYVAGSQPICYDASVMGKIRPRRFGRVRRCQRGGTTVGDAHDAHHEGMPHDAEAAPLKHRSTLCAGFTTESILRDVGSQPIYEREEWSRSGIPAGLVGCPCKISRAWLPIT